MQELLRENLFPHYQNLMRNIKHKNDIFSFCMQWGNQFPKEEKKGILFVGKATNGWVSKSRNVEELFGESSDRIFARGDQMKWVSNLENNKQGYNTRNSAFWRVIKRVSIFKNGKDDWNSKIAWSNLYKVSFITGNPTENLKKQQKDICIKILETEIKILSPKYIIFLTSGWEYNFVKYLTQDLPKEKFEKVDWGKNYVTKGFLVNGTIYITSLHPQGKNEDEHIKVIKQIINQFE